MITPLITRMNGTPGMGYLVTDLPITKKMIDGTLIRLWHDYHFHPTGLSLSTQLPAPSDYTQLICLDDGAWLAFGYPHPVTKIGITINPTEYLSPGMIAFVCLSKNEQGVECDES